MFSLETFFSLEAFFLFLERKRFVEDLEDDPSNFLFDGESQVVESLQSQLEFSVQIRAL